MTGRRALSAAIAASAVVAVAIVLGYAAAADAWIDPGGSLFVALSATWLFAGAGAGIRGLLRRARPGPA